MIYKFKKGNKIHIKKANRGKFTDYCGGKVTNECILRGKNSSDPAVRKRATFADNARHFKHRLGGIMNNKTYKFLNGNTLPEVTVVPTRLTLHTYYPITSKNYPYTGHSSLRAITPEYITDTSEGFKVIPGKSATIDKKSSDAGYNLVTNNCADATRCALETITGKKMNPHFFTTPGDVLDFFKENFDVRKVKNKNSGEEVYYTNITPKQLEMIREQLLELALKNRKERYEESLSEVRKKLKQRKEILAAKLADSRRKQNHKKGGVIVAEGGTKLGNIFSKALSFLNSDLGKNVVSGITSLYSGIKQSNNLRKQEEQLLKDYNYISKQINTLDVINKTNQLFQELQLLDPNIHVSEIDWRNLYGKNEGIAKQLAQANARNYLVNARQLMMLLNSQSSGGGLDFSGLINAGALLLAGNKNKTNTGTTNTTTTNTQIPSTATPTYFSSGFDWSKPTLASAIKFST